MGEGDEYQMGSISPIGRRNAISLTEVEKEAYLATLRRRAIIRQGAKLPYLDA